MITPVHKYADALHAVSADMDPNQAQVLASDPAHSVWVSASAGSGKTTVLTSRVVRLLLDGVAPQKILCLTYTRAAAAEMTIRIMQRLETWVLCDDDVLRADLDKLQNKPPSHEQMSRARRLYAEVLACPGGMRIRTIHAFAQEILGRFPLEAGLPPHFSLIEGDDIAQIKQSAFHAVIAEAAQNRGGDLDTALSRLSVRVDLRKLPDVLDQCAAHRASTADDDDPLMNLAQRLDVAPDITVEQVIAQAHADIPTKVLRRIAQTIHQEATPSHKKRAEVLLHWLSCSQHEQLAAWDTYVAYFLTQDTTIREALVDKAWRTAYPDDYDLLLREAHRVVAVLERVEAAQIYADSRAMYTVAACYAVQYARAKRDRGGLDYHDMIVLTEKLLNRAGIAPWILYKLDGGIDHIMVDEAQDTSLAQWSIISALAREFFVGESARSLRRTLFVVGDEKQSIFSFQGAAPEAFLKTRDEFVRLARGAGHEFHRVDMNTSFRSAPAILRAVDQVFARDDVRQGVASQPIRHNPAAKRSAADQPKLGCVELWPLVPRPPKNKAQVMEAVPTSYALAHDQETLLSYQIAERVADLLANRTQFSGMGNALQPRDIMILLSRRGRLADLLVRALKAKNIPVTGVDRMRLLQQLPVMDVLALLRFSVLPTDDLNLAVLLRGPLINLSEQSLMEMAAPREGSLWQAVQDRATQDPETADIYEYLRLWLARADYDTPFAVLSGILNSPCPASIISGRHALWSRLGEDALDPLNEVVSAALAFSTAHPPSVQMFLHSLEVSDNEIKREMDQGQGEDGGQVRIMTVHASKGLEASVVILANAAYSPGSQQTERLIPCGSTPALILRKPIGGSALDAYAEAVNRRAEEYRRLFYVALTRAAHMLIVAGCEPHRGLDQAWYGLAQGQWRMLADNPDDQKREAFPLVIADQGFNVGGVPPGAPEKDSQTVVLPSWLREKAVAETQSSLHNPSRLDPSVVAAPDAAFTRGRIIHRLLQSLPDCPVQERESAARAFLAHPEHHLSPETQNMIVCEVMGILTDSAYAPLFDAPSRAEVPIVGTVGGQRFSGQIDRLCFVHQEIWVVDYKTNRPPPATAHGVPEAYRRQMACYRYLLQKIYPDQTIRCFLLWTYAPKLMEIEA